MEETLRDTTVIPVHRDSEDRENADSTTEGEGEKPKSKYFQDTHNILEELEVHAAAEQPKEEPSSTFEETKAGKED